MDLSERHQYTQHIPNCTLLMLCDAPHSMQLPGQAHGFKVELWRTAWAVHIPRSILWSAWSERSFELFLGYHLYITQQSTDQVDPSAAKIWMVFPATIHPFSAYTGGAIHDVGRFILLIGRADFQEILRVEFLNPVPLHICCVVKLRVYWFHIKMLHMYTTWET